MSENVFRSFAIHYERIDSPHPSCVDLHTKVMAIMGNYSDNSAAIQLHQSHYLIVSALLIPDVVRDIL